MKNGLSVGLLDSSSFGLAPYGIRHNGEGIKGKGFFGLLNAGVGNFATELSVEDEKGEFPLLVPTLSKEEIETLLSSDDIPEDIYKKAASWAEMRRGLGISPFAQNNELRLSPITGGLLGYSPGISKYKP